VGVEGTHRRSLPGSGSLLNRLDTPVWNKFPDYEGDEGVVQGEERNAHPPGCQRGLSTIPEAWFPFSLPTLEPASLLVLTFSGLHDLLRSSEGPAWSTTVIDKMEAGF